MDSKLVAWARSVKAVRGSHARPLWLFSDERRMPDLLGTVARLPIGLCGVVFRHDGAPNRVALAKAVARLCRERRLMLSVAGDWRLAASVRAGVHMRGGLRPRHAPRWCPLTSSSAHGMAELTRARRARAGMAFLSPAFATPSHPGARPLGGVRWAALAGKARMPIAALGGVDSVTIRLLPRRLCVAAGAIGALTSAV